MPPFSPSPHPHLIIEATWEQPTPESLRLKTTDCSFYLSVERSAMASLLSPWRLGQKTSPHLGLTYPLAEEEKQEI